tara:strand:+ start:58 stop:279 length:222 start_codon:yes stop_codon:yes gene_type:complete
MEFKKVAILQKAYFDTSRTFDGDLVVFSSLTDMTEGRYMTEWGFPEANTPLLRCESFDGVTNYYKCIPTKEEE